MRSHFFLNFFILEHEVGRISFSLCRKAKVWHSGFWKTEIYFSQIPDAVVAQFPKREKLRRPTICLEFRWGAPTSVGRRGFWWFFSKSWVFHRRWGGQGVERWEFLLMLWWANCRQMGFFHWCCGGQIFEIFDFPPMLWWANCRHFRFSADAVVGKLSKFSIFLRCCGGQIAEIMDFSPVRPFGCHTFFSTFLF